MWQCQWVVKCTICWLKFTWNWFDNWKHKVTPALDQVLFPSEYFLIIAHRVQSTHVVVSSCLGSNFLQILVIQTTCPLHLMLQFEQLKTLKGNILPKFLAFTILRLMKINSAWFTGWNNLNGQYCQLLNKQWLAEYYCCASWKQIKVTKNISILSGL